MPDICLYLQVHQPYRLRRYRVFDIGTEAPYWDAAANRGILRRVADRSYLPTNGLLAELIRQSNGRFRVTLGMSGVVLEQLEAEAPDALASFRELVATGGVEVLGETYDHGLASLFSAAEFANQVRAHSALIQRLFGRTPSVFRNTELLYYDDLAPQIATLGFRGVFIEGADQTLQGRTPNAVYAAPSGDLRILPRNYRLSDDIAFRFSQRAWDGWPLTADRYASWLAGSWGDSVHICIDYETFGEHQWVETGIFEFLRCLPDECFSRGLRFVHPSELAERAPVGTLSIPWATSWADTERDASAWLGNRLQQAAFDRHTRLREAVIATGRAEHLNAWRRLGISDHFYYMSTKRMNDAEVHSYFNPYANPYDAFIAYMNVMQDLEQRVEQARAEPRLTPAHGNGAVTPPPPPRMTTQRRS